MADDITRRLLRRLPPRARQHAVRGMTSVREAYRAFVNAPNRASRWLTEVALETLPQEPAPPLQSFLRTKYHQLLDLRCRQVPLEAFDSEWSAVARGRTVTAHNDIVLSAMFDVRAMNVIDLCSWAIGTADRGKRNVSNPGLLGYVKRDYLSQLPPQRTWRIRNTEDSYLANLTDEAYCAARARLFPNAVGRPLRPADVDRLIEKFEREMKPVVDDRNKNHAHAYENRTQGRADPVSIEQMKRLHTYAWSILDDLGLMAFGEKWDQGNMTHADPDDTARELVDLIFLPEWFRNEMRARGIDRAACYDALHALPGSGDFNTVENLSCVADRPARRHEPQVSS